MKKLMKLQAALDTIKAEQVTFYAEAREARKQGKYDVADLLFRAADDFEIAIDRISRHVGDRK